MINGHEGPFLVQHNYFNGGGCWKGQFIQVEKAFQQTHIQRFLFIPSFLFYSYHFFSRFLFEYNIYFKNTVRLLVEWVRIEANVPLAVGQNKSNFAPKLSTIKVFFSLTNFGQSQQKDLSNWPLSSEFSTVHQKAKKETFLKFCKVWSNKGLKEKKGRVERQSSLARRGLILDMWYAQSVGRFSVNFME